ncbi:MAG: hypothetical protein IPL78_30545 [Chloroflexi bacterium]|nr:hypothetical protein [Chloroflexota bacterium]
MSEQQLQDLLSEDIHLLGDILGRVIRRQAGIEIYELEERIRSLAKARRSDDLPAISAHLENLVDSLDVAQAELIARAFTAYLNWSIWPRSNSGCGFCANAKKRPTPALFVSPSLQPSPPCTSKG